ncbi:hypothetical protein Tco_1422792, partial [Tanacetum coccineum]
MWCSSRKMDIKRQYSELSPPRQNRSPVRGSNPPRYRRRSRSRSITCNKNGRRSQSPCNRNGRRSQSP